MTPFASYIKFQMNYKIYHGNVFVPPFLDTLNFKTITFKCFSLNCYNTFKYNNV